MQGHTDREILEGYYAFDAVYDRLVEFLGGTSLNDATSEYLIGSNGVRGQTIDWKAPNELPDLLNRGCEISRSLWDRQSLLVHLDIEYVNFDFPGEAYLNPRNVFQLQCHTAHAIQELLLQWGISPLHTVTGRGHHFIWSVDRNAPAFHQLNQLGRVPSTVQQLYNQSHPPRGRAVDPDLGGAFAGLGLVMEYFAHLVREHSAPDSELPVQITDVEVGSAVGSAGGRAVISVDISEYIDPLHTRHIRMPFSPYLKPHCNQEKIGKHVVDQMPLMFEIPLFEVTEDEAVDIMRDARLTGELARRASVRIPDQSRSMENLVSEYQASSLARFHDWFYEQEQHSPQEWPKTYDRVCIDKLPSCAAEVLQHPNDLLLRPTGLQHVVRVLMSLGWHPQHIAGLIRSKYERDFGWGDRWYTYDARYRSEGYTRLFAGLVATGRDQLVDFNCVSNREKGYCFEDPCGHNLDDYRHSLTARRDHERLGCRPLDRLFFPD